VADVATAACVLCILDPALRIVCVERCRYTGSAGNVARPATPLQAARTTRDVSTR
jgi:hypothetical protein